MLEWGEVEIESRRTFIGPFESDQAVLEGSPTSEKYQCGKS